jgi:hypothetical protein
MIASIFFIYRSPRWLMLHDISRAHPEVLQRQCQSLLTLQRTTLPSARSGAARDIGSRAARGGRVEQPATPIPPASLPVKATRDRQVFLTTQLCIGCLCGAIPQWWAV